MLNDKTFRAIYSDYLSSGLTVRDFCANQRMNEAKFFYWQHKLKGELPLKRGGFVPVVIDNGQQKELHPVKDTDRQGFFPNACVPDKTATCEISYPNGVSVKLNGLTEAEMLRSLLALTRR
jgi:hypothetical protein